MSDLDELLRGVTADNRHGEFPSEESVMDWQPIETAPKDEPDVTIDVWVMDDDDQTFQMRVTDCMFVNGAWCVNEHLHEWEPLSVFNQTPTHWMPVPAPPQIGNRRA